MKKVLVEEAVGMVLGHDMTQIIPGEFKGARFEKGHIIQEEDIPVLKDMGKNHIYSFELKENQYHEDEAAKRIAEAVKGMNIKLEGPREGKMNLIAAQNGLLKINTSSLKEINKCHDVILATLHNNTIIEAGQTIAGTRINPLIIDREKIDWIETITQEFREEIIKIIPFIDLQVGILITGNEVYSGRVEDKFAPVLRKKVEELNVEVLDVNYVPDDAEQIEEEVLNLVDQGAEVVIIGGGMSVDPDDVTPEGIRKTGAEIETYGASVLPGSMFMLAYLNDIPLLGVPACGMFNETTVLDLVLPRVLSGEEVTREDIVELAHGGLCLKCETCRYPKCSFGKA